MKLTALDLTDFRTYSKRHFDLKSNTTIFVGPNAIGKTNILEAIFYLSLGKSFRAYKEKEVISHNQSLARVQGTLESLSGQDQLEMVITTGLIENQRIAPKKILVNGVGKRLSDFVGRLKVVLFEPEDVELVRGSPSKKRAYFDFLLPQVSKEYQLAVSTYEKAVRQRNALLEQIRDLGRSRAGLELWDDVLIEKGSFIHNARQTYIDFLNNTAKPFGNLSIVYDHSIISKERLEKYAHAEISAASTLVGPHRDNFFTFDGQRDLAHFGSRGEQRLVVLWLKLSELDFIQKKTRERPLLLLDDIFSELDGTHRNEVLSIVNKQQTILTSADENLSFEGIEAAEMVQLVSGNAI